MSKESDLRDLVKCYLESPQPSFKVTNYFPVYVDLFGHLRGTECTFIETGVLNGGSLYMWRAWLGDRARIIGIDLNPAAEKWRDHGFEIYIGDQGTPEFWRETFSKVGKFDVLLDDGGHQSFQQIVTLTEAMRAAKTQCIIAIEDTCTSFFREFSGHHEYSFLQYAKDSTDAIVANTSHFYDGEFPKVVNQKIVEQFARVYSVQFFSGIVAYTLSPAEMERPQPIWNRLPKEAAASDFRYNGVSSAKIEWPNLFTEHTIILRGGPK